MRTKRARRMLFYGGASLLLIFSGVAAAFWYELSVESNAMVRSYVAAERGHFDEIPKILQSLKTRKLYRVREYAQAEHPSVPLLDGISQYATGKYDEALASFLRSERICRSQWWARWHLGEERCNLLRAEAYFRAGDAVIKRWSDFAYSEVIALYSNGLLLSPDDPLSKKALDWLMLGQERAKKRMESRGGSDKLPFDRLPGLYNLPGKGSSPGGKERKGY